MSKFMKIMVGMSLLSPVLFLTYQKMVDKYLEYLWPHTEVSTTMWAFFAIVSSMVVGAVVASAME